MALRGVRGATTTDENSKDAIVTETKILLRALVEQNDIHPDDIASIFFSLTPDLDAEFPAIAARELGMTDVPLICMAELPVPNSLGGCIRILIHWNTDRAPVDIVHVYLKEAVRLRPDKHVHPA